MAQGKETLESPEFFLHQEDEGTFRKKKFKMEDFEVDFQELQRNQWKIFRKWEEQYMESEKAKYRAKWRLEPKE